MDKFTDKEYLAKGKRGIAYTALLRGKKVLVKEVNPDSAVNTIAHEAQILKIVNKKGVGPLFIALNNGALVREFIDGEEIIDWIAHARKEMIKKVIIDIFAQCRKLDLLGINKLEMTHPHKHILVRKSKPVFIDFDRAKRTEKPKNVTQVCQWITGQEMRSVLAKKSISLNREAMLEHAKSYKRHNDRLAYQRMIEMIKHA